MKFFLLLLLLSIPSIFSLFQPGFFQSDDGEWMIIRFSAFHQTFSDGQFPVRLLGRLNFEYGYPVADFLYPGFMYLAEFPKLLGFGFVDSIKIILGASMLGSAVLTFAWLRIIFGSIPAFFGALIYLYAPYHLYDIYKRGSVGEVLALAVVPFILWMIERKNVPLVSLGLAMLILSHNTLAILFIPLIVSYMMFRKILLIRERFQSIFLGFLVPAFFWVPALLDLQFTTFFQTKVSDFRQYFVGFDLLGITTILIFVLTFSLFFAKQTLKNYIKLTIMFFGVGLVSIFLSIAASSFVWNILPVSFIQFPFRFLSLTILCAAFLFASIIASLKKKWFVLGFVFVALSIAPTASFLTQVKYFDKGEGFYATNVGTTTVQNEYTPKWVFIQPETRPEKLVQIHIGKGSVENVVSNNREIRFTTNLEEEGFVRVNKHYFPGWIAHVNGKEETIHFGNPQGAMDIGVPRGKGEVIIRFEETVTRVLSDGATLIGLFGVMLVAKRKLKS